MKKYLKCVAVIMIVISIICCISSCGASNPTVLECNGLEIAKSTFVLCTTEEAVEIYKEVKAEGEEISQEDIISRAKEASLETLKLYTYYKQGYTNLRYTLDDQKSGEFRASVLATLLDEGLEFEASRKDEIFLDKFGVTFEEYMIYREEYELASIFYEEEKSKMEVSDEESLDYFNKNKAIYATFDTDIILISNSAEDKDNISEEIRTAMQGEYELSELKELYKDSVLKAETLSFDNTSNINESFGDNFKEQVFETQKDTVNIIKNDKGIAIVRTLGIVGYEDCKAQIQDILKNDKYIAVLDEKTRGSEYDMNIVDKEVYDTVSIPGF